MVRILFVCHGNICRSTMAEFVMKDLVKKAGLADKVFIDSAGTSREEEGHGVHPGTVVKLRAVGVPVGNHRARQITQDDFHSFDYIIGMDDENMWDMKRIYGGDPDGKLSLLLSWAGLPGREIDDPWYTRDFHGVLRQIEDGCRGLLQFIIQNS